ncbi:hybrid-cluster NAD(P)-dependent oxidoreductase [Marinomonas pollencensis]|uniref:Ferredoxin-NADP reductase n=1 Tax=Marinomonas pollencensis TaxID=491954 RepID=A0A3E0DIU3_9GAMM|nr:hybrid-cluster NAD(P)-dependent oxidoreductase [Marinomonas pollencensis]REG81997.1 ferredoxin-NADP reductase [Marinomonas pollencensis]
MSHLVNSQAETLQGMYWTDQEPLECVSVVTETQNCASFSFRAPSGALFRFLPGQFLTLALPVNAAKGAEKEDILYRTYTISSSPTRPHLITLTVKAQADSIGSRWMLDHLKPGMRLQATGPAGNFTNIKSQLSAPWQNIPSLSNKKFLFISAGSGATPMISMTTAMWDRGDSLDVAYIHCARRPSEILFRRRLEEIASRDTGLNLKFVVSGPDQDAPWTGYQGRFNSLMLSLMTPDFMEREVYCCGPQAFMESVKSMLFSLGFAMNNYYEESFHGPQATTSESTTSEALTKNDQEWVTDIYFAQSDYHYSAPPEQTILLASKDAGLNIPSGCTFGVCGTCKVKKLSGEVAMNHSGGISQADIDAGYILACCSRPIGDVTIDA